MPRLEQYGEPPVYRNPSPEELDGLSEPNTPGVTISYLLHHGKEQRVVNPEDVSGYWVGTAIIEAIDGGTVMARGTVPAGTLKSLESVDTAIKEAQRFAAENKVMMQDGKKTLVARGALNNTVEQPS